MNETKLKSSYSANRRVKTALSFESQRGREKLRKFCESIYNPGAHEARFSYLVKDSKYLSSYRTSNTPDFSKIKARDNNAIFCKNMILTDYSPTKIPFVNLYTPNCNYSFHNSG